MATIYTNIAANKRRSLLLVAFFVVIVLALGWMVDYLSGSGTTFIVFAAALALGMTLLGYFGGDKVVLWTSGARPLRRDENPYVYRIVENLTITAGIPIPKVYWIDDPAPNAFAAGRDPKHASVAVTRGLVELLENEELEGVLAHELSHIGNYDVRFMTMVSVLVGIVALLSDLFLRSMFWGGRRSDREGRSGAGILAIIGLVFIILSPIIGQLIQFAVSRKREFLADASGALLTRYPQGLAAALAKIGAAHVRVQRATNATAHLYFVNPFSGAGKRLAGLFSTHPPIEERIRALREMAGERGAESTAH